MQATYDDASLILKLYEIRREETLRKARGWFAGNFNATSTEEMMRKYPPGSHENTYIRMVMSYWDMAASFITAGVLNQDLFFQSNREMLLVWERLRPVIGGMREMYKDPHYCKNFETVANSFVKFMEASGPEAHAAFQARVKMLSASADAKS